MTATLLPDTAENRAALYRTMQDTGTIQAVSELLDEGLAELVLIHGQPGLRKTRVQ